MYKPFVVLLGSRYPVPESLLVAVEHAVCNLQALIVVKRFPGGRVPKHVCPLVGQAEHVHEDSHLCNELLMRFFKTFHWF